MKKFLTIFAILLICGIIFCACKNGDTPDDGSLEGTENQSESGSDQSTDTGNGGSSDIDSDNVNGDSSSSGSGSSDESTSSSDDELYGNGWTHDY